MLAVQVNSLVADLQPSDFIEKHNASLVVAAIAACHPTVIEHVQWGN